MVDVSRNHESANLLITIKSNFKNPISFLRYQISFASPFLTYKFHKINFQLNPSFINNFFLKKEIYKLREINLI